MLVPNDPHAPLLMIEYINGLIGRHIASPTVAAEEIEAMPEAEVKLLARELLSTAASYKEVILDQAPPQHPIKINRKGNLFDTLNDCIELYESDPKQLIRSLKALRGEQIAPFILFLIQGNIALMDHYNECPDLQAREQ